jgi:hypothetical protein
MAETAPHALRAVVYFDGQGSADALGALGSQLGSNLFFKPAG